jgi:hypothetical protein
MVVTLIIVLPGVNTPRILTVPWRENTSLQAILQATTGIFFALQYGGPVGPGTTPGYNLVMLDGYWASNESSTPPPAQPSYWAIQVNGVSLAKGVDEYIVEAGDVLVFTYNVPGAPGQ